MYNAWSFKTQWAEAVTWRKRTFNLGNLGRTKCQRSWAFSVRDNRNTNRSQWGTKEPWGGLRDLLPRIQRATRRCLATGTPSTLFVQELKVVIRFRIVACLRYIHCKCCKENRVIPIGGWRESLPCPAHQREKTRHLAWYRLCVNGLWAA